MLGNPVDVVLNLAAFMIGACVGSFLNVCIYRWPLNLKVDEPKRSFCPKCKSPIPMWRNVPIFSWLMLRGKCGDCKAPIPVRYVLVELLTALGFLAIWLHWPPAVAVALIFFFVCCMVTLWVDMEHYIIPDQVSINAVPLGLLAGALAPGLFDEQIWYRGLMWSALGALTGYVVLYGVVELGKKLFGRKRLKLDGVEKWSARDGEHGPVFSLGDEKYEWEELFSRPTDRLVVTSPAVRFEVVDGPAVSHSGVDVHLGWDSVQVVRPGKNGETVEQWPLEKVKSIRGEAADVVIPREAMGFGDVKWLAMAGCFIGWQGVFFTVGAASLIGTVLSVLLMVVGLRAWTTRIPFGPYLVVGAWLWLLVGEQWVAGYLRGVGIGGY